MCGRANCKIDPKILMKIFGCKEIKNQDKFKPCYNACPFKNLPVAYMRAQTLSKEEAQLAEVEQEREDEEAKDAGFIPNFDDSDSEGSPKIGSKRKHKEIETDNKDKLPKYEEIKSNKEVNAENGMNIEVMRWGMLSPGNNQPIINGRFEDLMKRQMFRDLLKSFRCIITVNGYYEWKLLDDKNNKQPYYIYPKDGEVLQLAGLFRPETQKDGNIINTFVILTHEAFDNLTFIHHRMPVILTEETRKVWLDSDIDFRHAYKKVYGEIPKDILAYYEVADIVNKHESPDCIMKKADYQKKMFNKGIGRFFSKNSSKKNEEESKDVEAAEPESLELIKDCDNMNAGITQMSLKETQPMTATPGIPDADRGIPLRLHPGKDYTKNKNKKFLSAAEKQKSEARFQAKRKKLAETDNIEITNQKLTDMVTDVKVHIKEFYIEP